MTFDKLSGIASILGLLLTIASYFTTENPIHIWLLSLTSIIFIFLLWWNLKQHNIATKYLKGESEIRKIHNKINLDTPSIKQKNFDGIVHELSDLCTEISEAFKEIKNEEIGVCIKYINGNVENPYVKTLCRDFHSKKREKKYKNVGFDYISQNTDFTHIIRQMNDKQDFNMLYYFANDLVNKHQYNNTHLKEVDLPSSLWCYFERQRKWPLPYRSTIVVPLLSSDNMCIDGFLCIDSPSSNGFIKERDVVIMQQIALFMRDIICYVCSNHLKKR